MKPAPKAAAMRSAIEAGERLVNAPLELRIEPLRRLGIARAAPAPDACADRRGGDEDAGDRQPPREQVEALPRRRREDRLAELRDELLLDLAVGRALCAPPRDVRLEALRDRRVRLVERRVAGRAHDLA